MTITPGKTYRSRGRRIARKVLAITDDYPVSQWNMRPPEIIGKWVRFMESRGGWTTAKVWPLARFERWVREVTL